MIKKLTILYIALCVSTPSAYAQKKGLVKGLTEALSSKATSAVSAQVERQVARATLGTQLERQLASQITQYHPVFGYKPFTAKEIKTYGLATIYATPSSSWKRVQVAPILQADLTSFTKRLDGFELWNELRPAQLAQAVYLWRMANPGKSLREQHEELFEQAYYQVKQVQDSNELREIIDDYPSVNFLSWLLDDSFQPQSYIELAATMQTYPKHVVLNELGFPLPAPQAERADVLDTYLLLADLKQMQERNNLDGLQRYQSGTNAQIFVLTPEEKQAAAALADLRRSVYQLPKQPTTRQLIEQSYNELESQAYPYSDMARWKDDALYEAYPSYRGGVLYPAIKQKLAQLEESGVMQEDSEYADYVHLIVLNALMGGVDFYNYNDVNYAIWAFDQLCKIIPNTNENIEHLSRLQQGLRIALGSWTYADMPFLRWEFENQMPQVSAAKIADLRYWAHELLQMQYVRNLIGKGLKY